MTVAERIRLARNKRGLGPSKLSEDAGLARTYVGMVERSLDEGRPSNEKIDHPGLEAIEKLARALDVPVEWLAFGSGPDPFADKEAS